MRGRSCVGARNVSPCSPACAAVGVHVNVPTPGFAYVEVTDAPAGSVRLATSTRSDSRVLRALRSIVSGCPALTVNAVPSGGVGACQTRARRGPRAAEAADTSASKTRAAAKTLPPRNQLLSETPVIVIQILPERRRGGRPAAPR